MSIYIKYIHICERDTTHEVMEQNWYLCMCELCVYMREETYPLFEKGAIPIYIKTHHMEKDTYPSGAIKCPAGPTKPSLHVQASGEVEAVTSSRPPTSRVTWYRLGHPCLWFRV